MAEGLGGAVNGLGGLPLLHQQLLQLSLSICQKTFLLACVASALLQRLPGSDRNLGRVPRASGQSGTSRPLRPESLGTNSSFTTLLRATTASSGQCFLHTGGGGKLESASLESSSVAPAADWVWTRLTRCSASCPISWMVAVDLGRSSATLPVGDRPPTQTSGCNPWQSVLNGYFELCARTPCCILPHFCPLHFFACLNPMFKNGSFLSVVALVSETLLDSNPRPSAEKKDRFWHRLPPPPAPTTIDLSECQERRGAKNNTVRVF